MIQQRFSSKAGFTLIEMMFMMAFLAILLMLSFTSMREASRQDAINSTAMDIKNWLQAALAYYADNNAWPNWPLSINDHSFADKYLPASLLCTQFAGRTPGGPCNKGNTSYMGVSSGKYYTVSAMVSDSATANAIAMNLPSSQVNGVTVQGSVPIPGAQQGYITSGGVVAVDGSEKVWVPPCQPGFEPHYLATPQYYTTGFEQTKDSDDLKTSYHVMLGLGELYQDSHKERWFVFANTNFSDDKDTTHYYAYYLTFCVPERNWLITGNSLPGDVDRQPYS